MTTASVRPKNHLRHHGKLHTLTAVNYSFQKYDELVIEPPMQ
jgi:hypothetical protein